MYLKSIEVHGFKSFANKIRFEFHEGITAIVGPNGSGKSNVADAVRWVLGEQRIKQLRGASMQDVIFSGTETRPAMGYASVSITLDNSDHSLQTEYDEVTVTRKLFRSGESEYLLNGNVCRLKDVNELFYDTGIGKEGYSIIGQGQIDKILSGKPEERRELFDEAAGIVKFKKRKDTALKKLENEKQNLVRVNDILSELERTIGDPAHPHGLRPLRGPALLPDGPGPLLLRRPDRAPDRPRGGPGAPPPTGGLLRRGLRRLRGHPLLRCEGACGQRPQRSAH